MSKLFYTLANILIWIVWPIVFIAGLIIVPRLIVLLPSISGLIFLYLIHEDDKLHSKEGSQHREQS